MKWQGATLDRYSSHSQGRPFDSGILRNSDIFIAIMRCVYLVQNTVNGKIYVGQTKDFAARKAGHLYAARKGCKRPLYRAIRKYGEEAFLFEILEECEDVLINEREQYWVSHYDSFNPEKGYNLTSGGNQNYVLSKDTKQKLHDLNIGEKNPMYGCHRFGVDSPMFGKKHSIETIARMSQLQTGKKYPGRILTEDRKRKIGNANAISQKGERNSQYGTVWIFNNELKKSQKIKKIELEFWLSQGWLQGRRLKW